MMNAIIADNNGNIDVSVNSGELVLELNIVYSSFIYANYRPQVCILSKRCSCFFVFMFQKTKATPLLAH